MQTFNEIKKIAFENDTNCCTVISASIIFDTDYKKMHSYFKDNGRKNGRGVSWEKYENLISKLAVKNKVKLTKYTREWKLGKTWAFYSQKDRKILTTMKTRTALTINNFRDYLPKGDYIFGVSGHVVAVKNGAVQDWTTGRAKRIAYIWTVEKNKNKVVKPLTKSKYNFSQYI